MTFDTIWRDYNGDLQFEIHINEGNRYFFRNISWKGNSKYTDEQLSNVLERAGGLTDMAFPEGAVFLREELKERERKQLEELSRKLETDLAALSLQLAQEDGGKVDSLDLLRLERLLLSIMEEQFKYINLFGALLGFLIGLANLFLLQLR